MKQLTLFKFLLVMLMAFSFSVAQAKSVKVSGKAPNFTLKSLSGKNVKLSEYRGQVVMINFWASWCAPCRQEMPLLENIYKKYKRLGFTLLGVNVEQDSSAAKKWLKDVTTSFPILLDSTNKVSKLYNVSAMPTTVLIDRSGNMRFLHKGYKPGYENDYKREVKKLIRE